MSKFKEKMEVNKTDENFEFPNQESYDLLKSVLKLQPRESIPGILPNKKFYLHKTYSLDTLTIKKLSSIESQINH